MNASSESRRAAEKAPPSRTPCGTPTPLTCGGVWGEPAGLARRARPANRPCSWGGTSCPPPPRGPGTLGETLSRPLVAVSTEGGDGSPSPPPPPSLAVPRTVVNTRARPSTRGGSPKSPPGPEPSLAPSWTPREEESAPSARDNIPLMLSITMEALLPRERIQSTRQPVTPKGKTKRASPP